MPRASRSRTFCADRGMRIRYLGKHFLMSIWKPAHSPDRNLAMLALSFRMVVGSTAERDSDCTQKGSAATAQSAQKATSAKPASAGYALSHACARCHQGIYTSFSKTDMGRSIVAVTPALLQSMHLPQSLYDKTLDRHFEVYASDGALYQSEYATNPEGSEIFRDTQRLDWIIGAGANGFGGIVKRGDFSPRRRSLTTPKLNDGSCRQGMISEISASLALCWPAA